MVRTRQRFFGAANVDPGSGQVRADRVIVSWFGCTSYAVAFTGTVLLLDAWIPRGMHSGYVPTEVAEIGWLRPAAIFIGHGHFDHAGDAGPIAQAAGARIFGTAGHCEGIRKQLRGHRIRCEFTVLGDDTAAPGTRHDFRLTEGVEVSAIHHLHSARKRSDGSSPRLIPRPYPRDILDHPPTLRDFTDSGRRLFDAHGGVLLYQFRTRGFTLTWHDSSGPLAEDGPQVLRALRELPGTDLHLGAIQGFNQATNGLRDPRHYIEALRPRVFVPGHHDNWGPLFTSRAASYEAPLRAELARIDPARRPELRFLGDPVDYIRPDRLTFEL